MYDKPFIHWNFVAALAYNKAQAQATYSYIQDNSLHTHKVIWAWSVAVQSACCGYILTSLSTFSLVS